MRITMSAVGTTIRLSSSHDVQDKEKGDKCELNWKGREMTKTRNWRPELERRWRRMSPVDKKGGRKGKLLLERDFVEKNCKLGWNVGIRLWDATFLGDRKKNMKKEVKMERKKSTNFKRIVPLTITFFTFFTWWMVKKFVISLFISRSRHTPFPSSE